MRHPRSTVVAALTLTAVVLSGCSSKAADDGGAGEGDVKTDFGVTDDQIVLGVQTDTSGIFKAVGLAVTHGDELWAKKVNADGGICGREVVLDIQDNGYKADNAIPVYEAQKGDILGYVQMLGSPIFAALKEKLTNEQVLTIASGSSSLSLDTEIALMIGTTYDVEMINAYAYLQAEGRVADGDTIGHIYIDSEYGQNGLLGAEAYAKDHDLEVIGVPISATDTDLTATITKLKSQGVTAIGISTGPAATGSAALQMKSQGMDIPLIPSTPAFTPNLLTDEAVAQALTELVVTPNSNAPFSADLPLATEIRENYVAEGFADEPSTYVPYGYAGGLAWEEILNVACDAGDLTRAGILAARKKVTTVDTEGLTGVMDFSSIGSPSTRETYILGVDPKAEGGLVIIEDLAASQEAKDYRAPFQK